MTGEGGAASDDDNISGTSASRATLEKRARSDLAGFRHTTSAQQAVESKHSGIQANISSLVFSPPLVFIVNRHSFSQQLFFHLLIFLKKFLTI